MKTLVLLLVFVSISSIGSAQFVTTIVDDASTRFTDDLIFDDAGNLYGADYSGTNVYKREPNGTVSVFASGFDTPNGMAFDSQNNMFICDNDGNAIYKLDITGTFLDTFQVNNPSGIIKDVVSDTMIFTRYTGHTLNKLSPDGVITEIFNGNPLNGPVGLAYNDNNDLFVANFTDREVYRIDDDSLVYVATLPGSGWLGFIANAGNDLWATAFNGYKIYKVKTDFIDSVELYCGSTQGSVDGSIDTATFDRPDGITTNAAGDTMYISQYGGGKLRMITDLTAALSTVDPIEYLLAPSLVESSFNINASKQISRIRIVSVAGEVMLTEVLNSKTAEVNIESLESGIYFVQLSFGARLESQRIVKL